MKRLGYHDELSPADLDRAVAVGSEAFAALESFDLELLPLAGSPGAVRLSVAPWEPLFALHRVAQMSTGVEVVDPVLTYRPHVGVAYSAERQTSVSIRAAVSDVAKAVAPVSIAVSDVLLVELSRAEGWYEWETLARCRLR